MVFRNIEQKQYLESLLHHSNIDLFRTADRSVSSHATYVASTVAGESEQMVGVAPWVRLLPSGESELSSLCRTGRCHLRFAVEVAQRKTFNNASFLLMVMCCSWRTAGDIDVIRASLEEVVAAGICARFLSWK